MQLTELVRTTAEVAAASARRTKVAALARMLSALTPDEIPVAVGLLLARPRQGRLGVGWRGAAAVEATPAVAPHLSLADVDAAFQVLADAAGPGAAHERARELQRLAARATSEEWDLLARVLRGELRTGALEGVLLDAVAAASGRAPAEVRRAAMLSGDVAAAARLALTEDAAALQAVGLTVGTPVLPMLASTAGSTADALAAIGGEASVEAKLDGARIQVHRRGADVAVYTRSLADITARVPEIVEIVRAMPAHSLILDGETLALDEDGVPRPFQDTMARFGSDQGADAVLRPWFFDILHLDGRDLLDRPLRERVAALHSVAPDAHVPGILTSDPAEAEEMARRALAAGHEGVMVKAADAPYAAGRRGGGWLKVKPVLTFDLVVLAVEWGSGRREGLLSNLHLGARDADGVYGPPGAFVMVGKTFKGLTDALLRWQTDHFPRIETRRSPRVVHVRPETVVEIAIDGVQRSSRYPGGVALRFARVRRYRPDKAAAEADDIAALRALLR